MATKLLLVGLDAADELVVDRCIADGLMPTLAALRKRGRRGTLSQRVRLGDDAVWSSFSTGLPPGVHGRWYHDRLAPDGRTLVPHTRRQMSTPPFWDALTEAGMRVAVVDVPKSPVGTGTAVVVADWMPHGRDSAVLVCSPAAIDAGLDERLAADADFDCEWDLTAPGCADEYVAALDTRAATRTDAVCDLLRSADWDLVVAVYAEAHCAGHTAWHDEPALHAVYRDLDRHLTRLLDGAGGDADVVVFSLLGMGPNHSGTHLLQDVLDALDPCAIRARVERSASTARRVLPASVTSLAQRGARQVERTTGRQVRGYLTPRVLPLDLPSSAIRWPRPGIRRSTLRALRTELLALEDADTGRRVVRDVVVPADADRGPAARDVVDVLVEWDPSALITAVRSPRVGTIRRAPPSQRTGNHRGTGWFVAAGPTIVPSATPARGDVGDLAPTVMALLGARFDDLPGTPIPLQRAPS